MHGIIYQNKLLVSEEEYSMKECGIATKYTSAEMLSKDDIKDEYLTRLLIAAHKLNPIFQKSCQNILDITLAINSKLTRCSNILDSPKHLNESN